MAPLVTNFFSTKRNMALRELITARRGCCAPHFRPTTSPPHTETKETRHKAERTREKTHTRILLFFCRVSQPPRQRPGLNRNTWAEKSEMNRKIEIGSYGCDRLQLIRISSQRPQAVPGGHQTHTDHERDGHSGSARQRAQGPPGCHVVAKDRNIRKY